MLKTEQDYVSEIKRLMNEGGLHEKFIFLEKKKKVKKQNSINNDNNSNSTNSAKEQQPDNNKNMENYTQKNHPKEKLENINEMMPVKPIQQTKSLIEWYQKLHLLPYNAASLNLNNRKFLSSSTSPYEDSNEAGFVRFYGMNNRNECSDGYSNNKNDNEDNYKKYYIYLREENDIELKINENKRYEWNITFLCDSYLIGIGLADKEVVKKNENKFLSIDENFNNGVYCLISTYNKECNIKEIRPWHCNDKNSVNHVANFPQFKNGRIVNLTYDSNNNALEFNAKKHSYKMLNVGIWNKDGNEKEKKILSPCVVFYYSGDEVSFTKIKCVNC